MITPREEKLKQSIQTPSYGSPSGVDGEALTKPQPLVFSRAPQRLVRGGGNGRKPSGSTIKPFALYGTIIDGAEAVGVKFGIMGCYKLTSGVFPWPSNYTAINHYKYEFLTSASGWAWIAIANDVSEDYYKVSSIVLHNGGSVPDNTDTTCYLPLGGWTYDDGVRTIFSGYEGIGNQFYNFVGYAHFTGAL